MKKILVTGGTRGIGYAIAERLLLGNCEVVITARKIEDGAVTTKELANKTGKMPISFVEANLSSIAGCCNLVKLIEEQHPDINILISNAGVWPIRRAINEDGLEIGFMVNYLSPFILMHGLKNVLMKNRFSRIVNVNAGLYSKGNLNIKATPYGIDFHPVRSYANSKLAAAMMAYDLAQEVEGSGLVVNSVHPGVVNTSLGNSDHWLSYLVRLIKPFWKPANYGAIAPVWLATDPFLQDKNGAYFNEREETAYSSKVLESTVRTELHNWSVGILESKKAALSLK